MQQISLDNPDNSLALTIGNGPSDRGPRLGGRAPAKARASDVAFIYFFTVPLPGSDQEEVSVFVNPDSDTLIEASGALASAAEIEVVRHAADARSQVEGATDSPLTEHPLVIGDLRQDVTEEDGEAVPFSGHKMGGRPYFVEGEPSLEQQVQELLRSGYIHLAQIDFPGNEGDADVSGPWPIGTGMIHVLARWDAASFEWACFWEL